MKAFITILLMSLVATVSLQAKKDENVRPAITRKMKSAGEKYVKMYLKEFPESAKGLTSSKARKKHYELLKASKVLTVDGETQKKLKRRKEVITDAQFQTMINKLVKDDEKETKFLLKLAGNKKLKGEGKLLIFRLLGQADKGYQGRLKEKAEQAAVNVLEHFKKKKAELGRKPADAEELALPETLATELGKDWVYIGTRLGLNVGGSDILFFNTVALPSGSTRAIIEDGRVITIKHDEIMNHWSKVKDKPAPKPKSKKQPNNNPSPVTDKDGNKPAAAPMADAEYKNKVTQKFAIVFKKVVAARNETKMWPMSLKEAGVEGDMLTVNSQDGTEKKPWIFLADKRKISVSKTQYLIMVSPYPFGQNHIIGLSDGQIASIPAAEFAKLQKVINGQ